MKWGTEFSWQRESRRERKGRMVLSAALVLGSLALLRGEPKVAPPVFSIAGETHPNEWGCFDTQVSVGWGNKNEQMLDVVPTLRGSFAIDKTHSMLTADGKVLVRADLKDDAGRRVGGAGLVVDLDGRAKITICPENPASSRDYQVTAYQSSLAEPRDLFEITGNLHFRENGYGTKVLLPNGTVVSLERYPTGLTQDGLYEDTNDKIDEPDRTGLTVRAEVVEAKTGQLKGYGHCIVTFSKENKEEFDNCLITVNP